MKRTLAFVAGALAFSAFPAVHAQAPQTLKLATLAPEGSSWMNQFHDWANAVEKRTNGGVKVKFYGGGVAGDERDAVRKMRLGQLNAAAVTAVGLGLIQPAVRVLEIPFMFNGYEELDYVRTKLDDELRAKFLEKGYVLLGWGDVGPVYVFSNIPAKTRDDMMKMKLWAWTDDPVVRTLFQTLGLNGVPLGVPDVLPSLSTGIINACYGSPLAALALQWSGKVKFITSMVLSQSVGAIVMTKAQWEKLTPEQQAIVKEESNKLSAKLLKVVRTDNAASLEKMKSQGIQQVDTPAALVTEFRAAAATTAQKLDGQLYTTEFRKKVEQLVADYRGGKR